MARAAWYRLDNIGKFYAAQAGRSAQTVFRIAADMSEPVDPDALQRALDATLQALPGFNVTLRSGFFWHYLEQSTEPLQVQEEHLPICCALHASRASVLTRVSYYGCRINVEVSHIISDGRGTLELFKTLIGTYVQLRYHVTGAVAPDAATAEEKTEDSFSKNYDKHASAKDSAPKPYLIRGWKDQAAPTYFEFHVPASTVHQQAKGMGVSVTSLIIAAIICAIRQTMPAAERHRAIRMDVPVDLRRFFGSSTLRNFFGLAYVSYVPGAEDEPLSMVAAQVQAQIASATEAPALKRRMNRMIKLEKNPLLRVAPLVLKDAVLGLAAKMAEDEVTTTTSSLGVIRLPDAATSFVKGVSVLTSTTGINFVACTFQDDLSISITSVYEDHRIIRNLVRLLGKTDIHGRLDVSKDATEVDAQLKQAALEQKLIEVSRAWEERRRTT